MPRPRRRTAYWPRCSRARSPTWPRSGSSLVLSTAVGRCSTDAGFGERDQQPEPARPAIGGTCCTGRLAVALLLVPLASLVARAPFGSLLERLAAQVLAAAVLAVDRDRRDAASWCSASRWRGCWPRSSSRPVAGADPGHGAAGDSTADVRRRRALTAFGRTGVVGACCASSASRSRSPAPPSRHRAHLRRAAVLRDQRRGRCARPARSTTEVAAVLGAGARRSSAGSPCRSRPRGSPRGWCSAGPLARRVRGHHHLRGNYRRDPDDAARGVHPAQEDLEAAVALSLVMLLVSVVVLALLRELVRAEPR